MARGRFVVMGTSSAAFRMWSPGAASQRHDAPELPPVPSEEIRANWRALVADETAPDDMRAICAMALLHAGTGELVGTQEVADLLGWGQDRTRSALKAAGEAGWTRRMP